jgi:hypothetical protein
MKERAINNAVNPKTVAKDVLENDLDAPLSRGVARELEIPYGGSNMKEVKNVTETVNDIAKMSDKEFKEFMQSNEYASMA